MKYKIFKPEAIHELGQRENQEDSIFPALGQTTTDDRLFILCDGMGGHSKGEVASQTVCAALSEYILQHFPADEVFTDEKFMEALAAAYRALDEKDDGALKKMGCTLTFLYLHRGGATVAHIGDSRVYHLRPKTGEVRYRTRDHSLVYDLFEVGELSLAEMESAPNKNIITRVMQPVQDPPCRADVCHITDIQSGDYFYLCSDGMLEIMSDNEILSILGNEDLTPQGKTKKLIAETVGNADNHTALIIQIEEVEKEPDFDFDDTEEAMRQRNKVLLAEEKTDLYSTQATQMTPMPGAAVPPPIYDNPSENDDLDIPEQYDQYGNVEGEVEIVPQAEPIPNMGMPNGQMPPKANPNLKYIALLAAAAAVIGIVIFFLLKPNSDNKERAEERQEVQREVKEKTKVRQPERNRDTDEQESSTEAKRKTSVEINNNRQSEQTEKAEKKPDTKKPTTQTPAATKKAIESKAKKESGEQGIVNIVTQEGKADSKSNKDAVKGQNKQGSQSGSPNTGSQTEQMVSDMKNIKKNK